MIINIMKFDINVIFFCIRYIYSVSVVIFHQGIIDISLYQLMWIFCPTFQPIRFGLHQGGDKMTQSH